MTFLRTPRCYAVVVVLALAVACLRSGIARAEPVLVSAEAQAALAVTTPQSQLFGPGAAGALAL
jgi:hypothetical protein